ncbi:MAG: NAD-dependent dihydropyrimidine dehydrogenase subunit PreA [Phycisphaerales bacterium]|nr:MAG: NAD-dependent dihydropyrimidine dehydrogenase subunit PreA [Phycisphaerales bacterium]
MNNNRILNLQGAVQEAGRCLLCHDAPCNTGCGADTEPATFILKLRLGDIRGAVRTMRRNNILAATCAQVCPTCRLCVEGCSRSGIDEPIRIAALQAFLADYERREKMQVLQAPPSGDRTVAIVGSGPAGLSAAAALALRGYSVVVYEKTPEPGGLLRWGIPEHRLPADLLQHEINLIKGLGVRFECGRQIKTSTELERLLRNGCDAVFLATGCDESYRLRLPGEDLHGAYAWDAFLSRSKDPARRVDLEAAIRGKRVVVVGGGSVAMDCAVTAKYLGAQRVYAVSLESMEELPADVEEKTLAFREGVRFKPNCRVTYIIGENGSVKAVHGVEIRWREPDRLVPENAEDIPGSEFSLPVDVLVEAIGAGLSADVQSLLAGVKASDGGRPAIDAESMRTSDPRIFAGGDLAGAGKTVASSVLDGKKAAQAIAQAFPLRAPVAVPGRRRPSLEIEFCGVRCRNPFFLSSSPVSNTAEMVARAFDAGWGGAVFKTLNIERDYKIIDPTPRLNALHQGDRRFIGLQNIEMVSERPFAQNLKDIAWLKRHYPDRMLIASIMGYSDEGWVELAQGAAGAGADMLELNFSCPQMAVEGAGHKIGQTYDLLERYTRVVKENVSVPVMAKMTPNITDMLPPSLAAKRGGADAISAINTLRAITAVDLETFAPMPTIQGRGSISGYSGPAVKPIALRFVAELAQSKELDLPVSGLGGMETWQDAAMFLLMGASNLQTTTAVMRYGYRIIESLCGGLEDYLELKRLESVTELVGRGLEFTVDPSEHHQTRHVISRVDPDTCIGCGLCHVVCHDGANQAMQFDVEKRKAEVDKDRCVGCLLCKHVCPVWDCITTDEIEHVIAGGMHQAAIEFVEAGPGA